MGPAFRARVAGLLKILSARRQRESLGAYEKVRVSRILSEANSGRMTFEQAQQSIGTAWIARYGPSLWW